MIVHNRSMSESTALQNPGTQQSWRKRCCHTGNSDGFTVISSCFFVFAVAVTGSLIIQIHFGTSEVTPHGAVATDDQVCSEIGIHTIRDGGSAADATIASLLCLSVTQPHIVGPGGGGVILVHDHKLNSTQILDFTVSFSSNSSNIGVPGFLKGLEKFHKLYGKRPFKDLFQPAIKLARNGFMVSNQLFKALNNENAASRFTPNFRSSFFPKGIAPSEGQILFRRTYADFLEVVSVGGADELHLYKYGTEMVNAFRALGSNISVHDFHNYEVIDRKVVRERIFNVSIFTVGPPFGGLQVVAGLELMKELGIGSQTLPEQLYDALTQGLLLGTALAKTKFTSDTDFLNETLTFTSKLTTNGFPLSDLPPPTISEPVSSQVSAVDTFDLYVAAIVGLGDSFGSGFMTEDGIIINQDSNYAKRGQPTFDGRHITPFTPLIAADTHNICGDRIVLASGSWGSLLQTCTQLIFRNLDMASAIDEPRIALGTEPKSLLLDDFNPMVKKLSPSVREHLKEGSNFKLSGLFVPLAVNGVSKHKDTLVSHSDTRGGGLAARLQQKAATNQSEPNV